MRKDKLVPHPGVVDPVEVPLTVLVVPGNGGIVLEVIVVDGVQVISQLRKVIDLGFQVTRVPGLCEVGRQNGAVQPSVRGGRDVQRVCAFELLQEKQLQ